MQLSLFDWNPTAQVVTFPLWRRRDLVHQIARTIAHSDDNASATAYWKTVANSLVIDLVAVGVPRSVARNEVRNLHEAVQAQFLWGFDDDDHAGGAG